MPFSIKHLAHTVQYLAIALLIWLAIGLIWQLLTPNRPGSTLRLAQTAPSSQAFNPDAVLRLFNTSTAVSSETSALSLKALISGQDGIAIIEGLEASAVAVKVGGDVGQYGKLVAAMKDHIVLERSGSQSKVYLPASAIASLNNAVITSGNPTQANTPVAAVANVEAASISLTRGQLTGILQGGNLANWSKGLGTSQAGGILVEQASQQQLAQVLQLRDGDILKAINGRPLNKLDDLSLLYGAFSQQTNLSLLIQRQDKPQTISYTVNP
nr:type II secretion system protein N [uncultured Deefgea sp.]